MSDKGPRDDDHATLPRRFQSDPRERGWEVFEKEAQGVVIAVFEVAHTLRVLDLRGAAEPLLPFQLDDEAFERRYTLVPLVNTLRAGDAPSSGVDAEGKSRLAATIMRSRADLSWRRLAFSMVFRGGCILGGGRWR